jgi:hypothetical protein
VNNFEPYRPSNGTEGEYFQEEYCYRCKHDDPDQLDLFESSRIQTINEKA